VTRRGNIAMIKELKLNESAIISAVINNAPPTLEGYKYLIRYGYLVACVDAAVKNEHFGGH